jgi:hypothetical protein
MTPNIEAGSTTTLLRDANGGTLNEWAAQYLRPKLNDQVLKHFEIVYVAIKRFDSGEHLIMICYRVSNLARVLGDKTAPETTTTVTFV